MFGIDGLGRGKGVGEVIVVMCYFCCNERKRGRVGGGCTSSTSLGHTRDWRSVSVPRVQHVIPYEL